MLYFGLQPTAIPDYLVKYRLKHDLLYSIHCNTVQIALSTPSNVQFFAKLTTFQYISIHSVCRIPYNKLIRDDKNVPYNIWFEYVLCFLRPIHNAFID